MQYQIKILLLSFVITIITSLAIIPILKKLKVGQMERTEGPQSHLGKQGTPTMGGIIFMFSILICTIGSYNNDFSNYSINRISVLWLYKR